MTFQRSNAMSKDVFDAFGFCQDLGLIVISTISFLIVRYFLYVYSLLPKSLNTDKPEKNYWFNVLGSLVHSVISGTWCLLCFFTKPEMAYDLVYGHDALAHALVVFSTGYFLYDVIDTLWMLPVAKSWEIVLHHLVVISCFGLSVLKHQFIGYAAVALLVEVNSIFLHIRQLLRLANVNRAGFIYKVNSIFNLGSFVVFRIFVLAYMTYWLVYATVPQPYYGIGVVGMFVMTVMNAILFIRLLLKDCFGTDQKKTIYEKSVLKNGMDKELKNGHSKRRKAE